MNIYRLKFIAACPANGEQIAYSLEIETTEMIRVEHLTTAAALHKTGFHEQIADDFAKRFSGRQVMKAHHHGVNIETRRGFEATDCGRLTQRVQVGSTVFEKGTAGALAVAAINKDATQ